MSIAVLISDRGARAAASAAARASTFLLDNQGADGMWRDFALPPGASEDWVTAVAGSSLLHAARPFVRGSVQSAARALLKARRPGGWGYHRAAIPDADSTAWAIRFLAPLGLVGSQLSVALLGPYLDAAGHAHTFRNANAGQWADAHDDVTSMVGLALLAARVPFRMVGRVRAAILDSRPLGGPWRSFWWASTTYAAAHALAFLQASGGVPEVARRELGGWLTGLALPSSTLEAAHHCALATILRDDGVAARARAALLGLQERDGGFPSSRALLVPSPATGSPGEGFADHQRVFGTAFALRALLTCAS